MKQVLYILLLNFPFILPAQKSSDSIFEDNVGIKWTDAPDWNTVKSRAHTGNKYIFIDVFATWCIPCHKMESDVFSDSVIADFVNNNFIAVKLQMDSTSADNLHVRNWYSDARRIDSEFSVQGFPSFLFFSPDGKLVFKSLGYKDGKEFYGVLKKGLDSANILLYEDAKKYVTGKKNYSRMAELAMFVKNVQGNKELAKSIAEDYEKNYLDNIGEDILKSKKQLTFYNEFNSLITPQSVIFKLCYFQPEEIDNKIQATGWSKFQVEQAIVRQEMIVKLIKDHKPVYSNVNWRKIQKTVSKKYGKVNASKLVLDFQISYYRYFDSNWKIWAIYKDKSGRLYPPEPVGMNVYTDLNTNGTWEAFLYCNDAKVLKKSIDWIDWAIKLDTVYKAAYLDTKANVLYKLGLVSEAIKLQEQAVFLDPKNEEQIDALEKMKKREVTYLASGAVWSKESLERIRLGK